RIRLGLRCSPGIRDPAGISGAMRLSRHRSALQRQKPRPYRLSRWGRSSHQAPAARGQDAGRGLDIVAADPGIDGSVYSTHSPIPGAVVGGRRSPSLFEWVVSILFGVPVAAKTEMNKSAHRLTGLLWTLTGLSPAEDPRLRRH